MEKIDEILQDSQDKVTITKVLSGCTPGKLQSVGLMQIIPLTSDHSDDKFASPVDAIVSTSNYGQLVFENKDDRPLLVPTGATYITKQKTQDHALGTAGFVKKSRTFNNARCVEQGQGGMMSKGNHPLGILPYSLRESALSTRKQEGAYQLLWSDIARMNQVAGVQAAGHLVYFMDHFKKQLNEFVAEFELVPKQVGAIILINGNIVGIERAPSYEFWKEVWEPLIRECYGSEAIMQGQKSDVGARAMEIRTQMDVSGLKKSSPLSDVRASLDNAQESEEELVRGKIRSLLTTPFKVVGDETFGTGITIETVSNKQLTGQVIREGETFHYASLTTIKNFQWAAPASTRRQRGEDFTI